jgi:hypothetical protein
MCEMSPYLWPDHGSFSSGNSFVFAVSLYLAYYAATLAAVIHAIMYANRAYRTNWFKGAVEKLEWEDVKQLMTADPVESEKDLRLASHLLRDVSTAIVGAAVWVVGIFAIGVLARSHSKENIEAATFLFGFLSLTGAAAKATYEWRLKARSENRQRWIDQFRDTLSILITNIPDPRDFPVDRDRKAKVYMEQHGKLELLMNPSERDHRGLMALVRHMYGHSHVPIDDIPRKHLGFASLDPLKREDHTYLKTQLVRLSNAALKREWERVKRIQ